MTALRLQALASRHQRSSSFSRTVHARLVFVLASSSSPSSSSLSSSSSSSSARRMSSSASSASSSTSSETTISLEKSRLPAPPPPVDPSSPGWSSSSSKSVSLATMASPVDKARRIFCNRTLNMSTITCVGFDMDYTLAQYRPETFETLVFRETCKKLVSACGYPLEVLSLDFDCRFMVRGLTIDKRRGNVIKMDRHKYVKIAYHGLKKKLSREERLRLYAATEQRDAFDEPDYALIDTLFSLAEAHLFAQLVDMKDANIGGSGGGDGGDTRETTNTAGPDSDTSTTSTHGVMDWKHKDYEEIYRDVRRSVDLVHRDGSLKQAVADDPGAFIHSDEGLPELLVALKESGRKVFIVTNSLWDYTDVVMNYLLGKKTGKDRDDSWMNYFDLVVTGGGKPGFFFDAKRQMFRVDTSSGMLLNTDEGAHLDPIGGDMTARGGAEGAGEVSSSSPVSLTPVYQAGNYKILHQLLGVRSGSEVLYVGDHIYGDIVRSKKSLGWRTMLVVPELEHELEALEAQSTVPDALRRIREERDGLDDQIHRLEWQAKHTSFDDDAAGDTSRIEGEQAIARLKAERDTVRAEHSRLLKAYHESFHSVWGQLLKTGYQHSRFASQVERFACLYTSHVSNMRRYSPERCFRSREDEMPHEQ